MAANKFATMLHRNTNKPTMVLVYAFLEWILIVLLLMNSLLSYLILKFADYFGLKRPCICCSRIEHIIEPKKCTNKSCFRDLVCESHASEISKLGYCYNHRQLAESEDMCEDCSSSSSSSELDYVRISKSFGFFPWMKQKIVMNDRKALKCSCCGVHLESRLCAPCPLDHTQMHNLITQDGIEVDAEIDEGHGSRSDSAFDHHEDEEDQNANEETMETHNVSNVEQSCEQKTGEIPPQHLEFFIHGDNCSLIPFELIESSSSAAATTETQSRHPYKVAEGREPELYDRNEDVILDFDMLYGGAETEPVFENWHTSGDSVTDFSSSKRKPKSLSVSVSLVEKNLEQNVASSIEEKPSNHNLEAHVENRESYSEEVTAMQGDEFETEVSIGTEIPDHEQVDEYQIHDIILQEDSNQQMQEDPSTSSVRFHVQHETGGDKDEGFVEFQTMTVETSIPKILRNHLEYSSLEFNENEAENIPDTPTSVERKESGAEESFDGSSTISDIEPGELTVEKLKSALKAERKALSSIYAELEEERSASAVAANQTMAMINRLQEEKAAMQMEALQYQRMMEEQSEYDHEALQLLNDLMVKREKEKQDLGRELETYRKKFQELDIKEKPLMSNSNLSVSCSNEEDSDGLSVDLYQEEKEENGFHGEQNVNTNTNTPVDAVLFLEESLADFEEERLSILEQLKVLEKKCVMVNHEEDDVCHENENGYYNNHVNGFENGHSHIINGGKKIMGQKGKKLLPLFDAIGKEEDAMDLNLNSMEENDLEEELDDVYERLQALEADREFLKHCISSMRKGDKGLHVLQDILQYLHDLRNVDLRVKNLGDLAV